eukprot:m.45994 g.45994  ORF g.45994 m.45994 type:complete len:322 (+) comp33654_c0_seq1:76-1041(+)
MAEAEATIPTSDSSLSRRLECSICQETLKKPKMTPCRHIFCSTCIDTWLNPSPARGNPHKTCPVCRKKLTARQLEPPPALVSDFLSLVRVKCSRSDLGCKKVFAADSAEADMKQHDKECDYVRVSCARLCGTEMMRKDVETHNRDECPQALIKCPGGCGRSVMRTFKGNCVMEHVMPSLGFSKITFELGLLSKRVDATVRRLHVDKKDLIQLQQQVQDIQKDVETLKKETTYSLTTILQWIMPKVDRIEGSLIHHFGEAFLADKLSSKRGLTFSTKNRNLLNPVRFPKTSCNQKRQCLSLSPRRRKQETEVFKPDGLSESF